VQEEEHNARLFGTPLMRALGGALEASRERLAGAKDEIGRLRGEKDELLRRLETHGEDIAALKKDLAALPRIHVSDRPPGPGDTVHDGDLWIQPSGPVLSEEARALLIAAAKDNGIIMRVASLGGTNVQAGGRNFVESDDPRSVAKWESAVDELERGGLTEDKGGKREVYFITHEGFRATDSLAATS
jgi:hypothetical protein